MYNISRGQLLVLVAGAFVFWLYSLVAAFDYSPEWWQTLSAIFTPVFVIFYFIGWRRHHAAEGGSMNAGLNLLNKLPSKRSAARLIIGGLALVVIFSVAGAIYNKYILEPAGQRAEAEEYIGRFSRLETHIQTAQKCRKDFVASRLSGAVAECKLRYDNAYAKYRDCRDTLTWKDHRYCINEYGSNYEIIDCSEATITKEIERQDYLCYMTAESEFIQLKIFEKSLVDLFIASLPVSKASLTKDDVIILHAMFPQSVFNDRTASRINEYLTERGYKVQ